MLAYIIPQFWTILQGLLITAVKVIFSDGAINNNILHHQLNTASQTRLLSVIQLSEMKSDYA